MYSMKSIQFPHLTWKLILEKAKKNKQKQLQELHTHGGRMEEREQED